MTQDKAAQEKSLCSPEALEYVTAHLREARRVLAACVNEMPPEEVVQSPQNAAHAHVDAALQYIEDRTRPSAEGLVRETLRHLYKKIVQLHKLTLDVGEDFDKIEEDFPDLAEALSNYGLHLPATWEMEDLEEKILALLKT